MLYETLNWLNKLNFAVVKLNYLGLETDRLTMINLVMLTGFAKARHDPEMVRSNQPPNQALANIQTKYFLFLDTTRYYLAAADEYGQKNADCWRHGGR